MLIVCPTCASSYNVEPASLGAAGRSVRCVRCRNIWFATHPDMAEPRWELPDVEIAEAPVRRVSEAVAAAEAAFQISSADDAIGQPQDEFAAEPSPDLAPRRPSIEEVAASIDRPIAAETAHETQLPARVTDAPPLAPADLDNGAMPAITAEDAAGSDIETFAARRALRDKQRRHRSWATSLPVAILLLIVINAALIGWRAEVVRYLPQTASLYAAIGMPVNLRGVTFANVRTTRETHEGVTVLAVEGAITSVSNRTVEIPRLRFAVRNDAGHEIYAWTALPSRTVLAPGETLPFRSRLASPPPEAREVLVRFFNRRDLAGSIQ